MTYSMDTCALVKFNRTMPHDIVPSLWTQLDNMCTAGKLLISEEVKIELDVGNDWIKEWVKDKSGLLVKSVDVQDTAIDIINSHNLVDPNQTTNQADPFVIAVGEDFDATVVSDERNARPNAPLLRIPDVCQSRGIGYLRYLDFLRDASIVL